MRLKIFLFSPSITRITWININNQSFFDSNPRNPSNHEAKNLFFSPLITGITRITSTTKAFLILIPEILVIMRLKIFFSAP